MSGVVRLPRGAFGIVEGARAPGGVLVEVVGSTRILAPLEVDALGHVVGTSNEAARPSCFRLYRDERLVVHAPRVMTED